MIEHWLLTGIAVVLWVWLLYQLIRNGGPSRRDDRRPW